MKACGIKGFPANLWSSALKRQHNFAYMFGGLHPPLCSAAFSSGNVLSITGLTFPSRSSGITLASIAATMAALSALLRGRSVEPVWVRRFTISLMKLAVAFGAFDRNAICTMRPSMAAAS